MMKKTLFLLLALVATLSFAHAGENAVKNPYTHHYDFKDFTELSVSNAFHVDFAFADTWSVDISVPDFIQPYLKVNRLGDKVKIGLDKLPRDVQRKLSDLKEPLQATVRMPKLLALSLSGASRLQAEGRQELGNEAMSIDLSGASRLQAMTVSGKGALHLELSGASRATLDADFPMTNIGISGASHLNLTGNTDKARIDCSGASHCKIEGDVENADIGLSGSSSAKLNGQTGILKLDMSGASHFESTGETASAYAELSGASKAKMAVTEKLHYELSGASTLRVRNLDANVTGEQSRGSKLSFER